MQTIGNYSEIRKIKLESRYDISETKRVSSNFYNNGYGKGKTREKTMCRNYLKVN